MGTRCRSKDSKVSEETLEYTRQWVRFIREFKTQASLLQKPIKASELSQLIVAQLGFNFKKPTTYPTGWPTYTRQRLGKLILAKRKMILITSDQEDYIKRDLALPRMEYAIKATRKGGNARNVGEIGPKEHIPATIATPATAAAPAPVKAPKSRDEGLDALRIKVLDVFNEMVTVELRQGKIAEEIDLTACFRKSMKKGGLTSKSEPESYVNQATTWMADLYDEAVRPLYQCLAITCGKPVKVLDNVNRSIRELQKEVKGVKQMLGKENVIEEDGGMVVRQTPRDKFFKKFLNEVGIVPSESETIRVKMAYELYVKFCKDHEREIDTRAWFGVRMSNHGMRSFSDNGTAYFPASIKKVSSGIVNVDPSAITASNALVSAISAEVADRIGGHIQQVSDQIIDRIDKLDETVKAKV